MDGCGEAGEAQDVIKFDMLKYEPKKVSGFGFSERNSDRASIGSVILPIPGGISDATKIPPAGDSTMAPNDTKMAQQRPKLVPNCNQVGFPIVQIRWNF